MNDAEMRKLQRGNLVRHLTGGPTFVVTSNYGTRVTAAATADLTNASEWELVARDGQPTTHDTNARDGRTTVNTRPPPAHEQHVVWAEDGGSISRKCVYFDGQFFRLTREIRDSREAEWELLSERIVHVEELMAAASLLPDDLHARL